MTLIKKSKVLNDLLYALEQNLPVEQDSRMKLLFGIKDYLASDNGDLAICLGVRGKRNSRMMRNIALRKMCNILNESNIERTCTSIKGWIEQAELSPPTNNEPELLKLARTINSCGVKLPGIRQLRSIIE